MTTVTDRLSALDASFLYLEDRRTPRHVGTVMVFEPSEEGFDYERLLALVSSRIAYVPRYRQRVKQVAGGLLDPVWVDDPEFDITYHVRRSALPRPGTDAQLEEFVARIQARELDRLRPLWELYLVEGLEHGRFAIVTKSHQAMVDGITAMDIGQVIVDSSADSREPLPHHWSSRPVPSDLELAAEALMGAVRSPKALVRTARTGVEDARRLAGRVGSAAGGVMSQVARSAARPAPASPLNVEVGPHRRYVMLRTDLKEYQKIRRRVARATSDTSVNVNDVVLATITGALRSWLQSRGESVTTGDSVRALVPVSVMGEDGITPTTVSPCYVDLPVGEPRPMMRLFQVSYAMRQQTESHRAVGADRLSEVAGFAPPTLHSLGARVGNAVARRMFNLVVTNVPGPQQSLYVADARMSASHPVIPLGRTEALSIGLTSYDGGVYFGLLGDRDAMGDLGVLGQSLSEALDELMDDREALP